MFGRILLISFMIFGASASVVLAETEKEKEFKSKMKKYCGDHVKFVEKRGAKSECQNADNRNLALRMNSLSQEALKHCEETVKFLIAKSGEFDDIVAEGTKKAQALKTEVANKNLNMNELHQVQEQGVKTLYNSAVKTGTRIRSSFESHHEQHNVLSSLEKTYEKLKDQIGYQHDEQKCSGQERKWYGVEAYHLEEEMETLRELIAKRMQQLSKLYQENLVTLGASKSQALNLARDLVNAKSMGTAPLAKPEGLEIEAPSQVSVRNDGLLEGAERGSVADKLDRVFGRNRPYEKEWQQVNCPEGVDAPGCWERGYKATSSTIDDNTLAAFSGKLDTETAAPGGAAPNSGGSGSLLSDMMRAQKLGDYAVLPPDMVTSIQNQSTGTGTVEIDGTKYHRAILTTEHNGVDEHRMAYVPDDNGGYRAVPIDNNKVKLLEHSEVSPVRTSAGPQVAELPPKPTVDEAEQERQRQENMQRAHEQAERELASLRPTAGLANPSVLPGHGSQGVTRAGLNKHFEDTVAAMKVEKDGKLVEDGFHEFYNMGRQATYHNVGGEAHYTGQVTKSDSVRSLQSDINSVLQEAGYKDRVVPDGVYGSQTHSALNFIAKEPELRQKLLQKQGRVPASK